MIYNELTQYLKEQLKMSSHLINQLIVYSCVLTLSNFVWAEECDNLLQSSGNKEKLLIEARAQCPNHIGILNALAAIAVKQHQFKKAEELYQEAKAKNSTFPVTYIGLGDLCLLQAKTMIDSAHKNEQYQRAKDYYNIFLSLEANDAHAINQVKSKITQIDQGIKVTPSADSIIAALTEKSDTRGFKPKIDLQILFETNSAQISQESVSLLQDIRSALISSALLGKPIKIIGHTDSQGDDQYNFELSQRRAQSVLHHLQQLGVSETTLTIEGKGEVEPVASNTTEQGRAKNRRVTLQRMD